MKKTLSKLAINGGAPVLKHPLKVPYLIGKKEIAVVNKLLKEGPLSDFIGAPGKFFLGGKHVRSLEAAFVKKFKVKHAVSFNSATTALHGAIVALGIGPGDEVIVPPYTMSATPMAVLMNGAVPIFADILPGTFCLDAKSVEKAITKRTKAIFVANLFGQTADFGALLPLAKKYKLKIIEDNAQAAGALWRGRPAGTIGDIGVFSFNVHKTIQSGEGGVLVTDNKHYALRAQLCRNHGENLAGVYPEAGLLVGSNYRMTELTAALCEVQLSRLEYLTKKRRALVAYLGKSLKGMKGIIVPPVSKENYHVYYVYPLTVDEKKLGISRDTLVDAMTAEGHPMSKGYLEPLYLLPIFQKKQAFNATHFPFDYRGMKQNYKKGICPVTERLYEKEFTFTMLCQHPRTKKDIGSFVRALKKVLAHKNELQ
ncbi:MAG: DegT/DnrJ/EryC1/StrS family aminotransferase [bacterium]|nr:DegT/DnrJ/EryC1/StrS family aminotransferase [bacterium]